MEEEKEQKKAKIKKLIKIISFSLLGLIIIILLIGTCKKTKANEMKINYRNYNMLIAIETVDNIDHVYEGTCTVISLIENNEMTFITINDDYPDFQISETTLLNGPYETYGATEINASNLYLVQSLENYPSISYTLIGASEYNTYMEYQKSETYNQGAETSYNTTQSEAYNQGYNQAEKDLQQNYNKALNTLNEQYENGLNAKEEEITRLQGLLNDQNVQWGSFKSLLGLIITYPIQLFKEGLNVELFGVNVGQLILGIALLVILITVIGFIIGGRIGGKKE